MAVSDQKVRRPFRASAKPPPGHRDSRWEGGGPCTPLPTTTTANRASPRSLAPGEGEVYLYLRVDFNRLSVQEIRPVLPLLHGFDCRRSQHRMPAYQLQILDGAF